MDIVYASLGRKMPAEPALPGEAAEVLDALWAHTIADDGLEHASAQAEPDRVDLLLYLLTRTAGDADTPSGLHRAEALLHRSHQASPALRRRYLPPHLPPHLPAATPRRDLL